jgi:hypothetical protein
MPTRLQDYARNMFSKFGEDGVIERIFEVIGSGPCFAVEFGAADGIRSSNTRNLIINHGWSALLIEGKAEEAQKLHQNYGEVSRVTTLQAVVFPGNVEILLEENGVPKDLDLLVIDIDSNDYYVWRVIHEFRPRVVMIEINPLFPPPAKAVIDFHPMNFWDRSAYFGASFQSMYELGKRKGYEAVYCTPESNLIFVDSGYYPALGIESNDPEVLWVGPAEGGAAKYGTCELELSLGEPHLDVGPIRIEKKFILDKR